MPGWTRESPIMPPYYLTKSPVDGQGASWTCELPYTQIGPPVIYGQTLVEGVAHPKLWVPLADLSPGLYWNHTLDQSLRDKIAGLYFAVVDDVTGVLLETIQLELPSDGYDWTPLLLHAPMPCSVDDGPNVVKRLHSVDAASGAYGVNNWPEWALYYPMGDPYPDPYGKVAYGGWLQGVIWVEGPGPEKIPHMIPKWSQGAQIVAFNPTSTEPIWSVKGWRDYSALSEGSYEIYTPILAANGKILVHFERFEWTVQNYQVMGRNELAEFGAFDNCRGEVTHEDTFTGDGVSTMFQLSVSTSDPISFLDVYLGDCWFPYAGAEEYACYGGGPCSVYEACQEEFAGLCNDEECIEQCETDFTCEEDYENCLDECDDGGPIEVG